MSLAESKERNRRFEEYVSSILTKEERLKLHDDYDAACKRGDDEEALKIAVRLPLAPYLVDYVREIYTPEELEEIGFDLTGGDL